MRRLTTLKAAHVDRESLPPSIDTSGHVRHHQSLSEYAPPHGTQRLEYTIDNLWWLAMQKVIEARYPGPDFN